MQLGSTREDEEHFTTSLTTKVKGDRILPFVLMRAVLRDSLPVAVKFVQVADARDDSDPSRTRQSVVENIIS